MTTQSYHVWYLQESDLPAVVELAYIARTSQAINHMMFRDWPDEGKQRSQCERAVKSAFNDPSVQCTIVKSDETGEIVAFCITKRNIVVQPMASGPSGEAGAQPYQALGQETAKESEPALELHQTLADKEADKSKQPQYHESMMQIKSATGQTGNPPFDGTEQSNINNGTGVTQQGSIAQVKTTKGSGLDGEQMTKTTSGTSYRNSYWNEHPGPDEKVRAIYAAAREHMAFLDNSMIGVNHLELEYLWVKPGHRGRGIGKRFMENCTNQALSEDLPLFVRAEPTAHDFYLKWRFVDVMLFTLELSRYAPPFSGYGEFRSFWMLWSP